MAAEKPFAKTRLIFSYREIYYGLAMVFYADEKSSYFLSLFPQTKTAPFFCKNKLKSFPHATILIVLRTPHSGLRTCLLELPSPSWENWLFPKDTYCPLFRSNMVLSGPRLIWTTDSSDLRPRFLVMLIGLAWESRSSVPSWPWVLSPQLYTCPYSL